jgi:hypothetical protein
VDDRDRRYYGALAVIAAGALVLITLGPPQWASTPDEGGVPDATSAVLDAAFHGSHPATVAPSGFVATPAPSAWFAPTPGHGPKKTPPPTPNPTVAPTAPPPTSPPTSPPSPKPTVAPTAPPPTAPPPTPGPTAVAGCGMFPATNVWNRDVSTLPVASNSATMIAGIGLTTALHPDFSSLAWNGGLGYGIPFNKVGLSTPTYPVSFQYADESDPGPYPIPSSPKIEGGSDRHLLLWDTEGCRLFEIFDAVKASGGWTGGSGAIWDLTSNALRPDGWTSADAAGLPILPGLVRYDEVAAGAIRHALRFTASRTCANHIYPARHDAGSYSCSSYPPMGLRVRLKASVDLSGFGPQARIIVTALKRYGMLLADNGSSWYVTGAPNADWNDDDLHGLGGLHGSDFEVVDTSGLR